MVKRNAIRLLVVLLTAALAVVGGTRTASANPNPTIHYNAVFLKWGRTSKGAGGSVYGCRDGSYIHFRIHTANVPRSSRVAFAWDNPYVKAVYVAKNRVTYKTVWVNSKKTIDATVYIFGQGYTHGNWYRYKFRSVSYCY